MEEITIQKKNLLPLEKQSCIFKLIIPMEVESKIRFLCRNIPNTEWSGVLFYKIDGSFEGNSLAIICVDIFQMDEGSATYTEFNMSPEVCTYICNHPELTQEGIYQGLVHSHNNMNTFFSGTDINTLQEEGNDMNHFVSLIVNNAGNYTAAITRKIKKVKTVIENYSYNTWGGKEAIGKATYTLEEECIEYYYLNIAKAVNNFESEMSQRLEEIRESKRKSNINTFFNNNSRSIPTTVNPMNYGAKVEIPKVEAPKEQQTHIPFEFDDNEGNIPYGNIHADKEVVEDLIKQIVTSSVIIPNNSKIDIKRWASSMPKLYRDRFGDLKTFEEFAINYVDFLINNADCGDCGMYGTAILAYDIVQALKKLPQNDWLDEYMSILDDYIL